MGGWFPVVFGMMLLGLVWAAPQKMRDDFLRHPQSRLADSLYIEQGLFTREEGMLHFKPLGYPFRRVAASTLILDFAFSEASLLKSAGAFIHNRISQWEKQGAQVIGVQLRFTAPIEERNLLSFQKEIREFRRRLPRKYRLSLRESAESLLFAEGLPMTEIAKEVDEIVFMLSRAEHIPASPIWNKLRRCPFPFKIGWVDERGGTVEVPPFLGRHPRYLGRVVSSAEPSV